ncbi:MAG: M23 family metallopeptidase [Hydrogenoanaerobacterium sp.]
MAQKLILPINKCVFSAGYKNIEYKKQQGYSHYGVDLFGEDGLAVYACGDGTVVAAGMDGGALNKRLGNCIVIVYRDVMLHSGKICDIACRMFHFSKLLVKAGQSVTKDTVIGLYGNTGSTTVLGKPMGYHLHLELDTDTKYPQYAVGISGSGSIIKRGTADSTINPSSVWYMDKNQSIWGKYPGWYTTQDVELPRLAEVAEPTYPAEPADPAEPQRCTECEKLRTNLIALLAELEAVSLKIDKLYRLYNY